MTAAPGTVLGDRYELGAVIGIGGMADVYRATDRVLGRAVAVKVLRETSGDETERDRFAAEARTLASLDHPGLVTLLDAGVITEHPYLVMQLVEGPSLAESLRETGHGLEPARVAAMGCQVAEALAYAHQKGVVHRDVKPGNILITPDDRVLLTDFGIARLLADAAHHTRTGQTIGSPAYLSPEQVDGGPLTAALDVYSLGLVLLEALTGARAFPGPPIEAAVARLTTSPALPSSLDPGWRELLEQMTQRDPAPRPSALEVAATLGASVAAGAVPRPTPGATQTAVLDLTAEVPAVAVREVSAGQGRFRGSLARMVVAAAVAVAAVVAVVALAMSGEKTVVTEPTREVPPSVPSRMQEPLAELHDAVEGLGR